MPLLALADSELRYTCDADGSIELHLSEYAMFEGQNGKFKGRPIPWEQTIPINRGKRRLTSDPIQIECSIQSNLYIVEIVASWEGNLSEPAMEGHRFFPSVSITSAGKPLLSRTNLAICQMPSTCPGNWAVRVLLNVARDKPVVTAYRLYLDWTSP